MIINDANQALVDNAAFIQSLNSKGQEKTAGMMTDFVRIKLRETSFSRKILPPKPVTATDLVQQLTTDQPMRIVELDRLSKAYPVTFVEPATQKYYEGTRFPVYYTKYQSEEFFKPVEEIMTYRVPIKTIVQENYLKDIQIAEDATFIKTIDKIIADRETASVGDAKHTAAGPLTPAIMAEGLKLLAAKEVPEGPILINEQDFIDFLKWTQATVGSAVMEDIVANGYSYTKLFGRTFIRTIKNDIVAPGNVYLFSTPEFMGVFDILTDVKVFVEQKASNLRFYLYETVGVSLGNVNGFAKISLT